MAERTIQFEKERLVSLKKHFEGKPLGRITAEDIADYQQARAGSGISGRTINMEIGVLQRMLKKAKRWTLLAEDVTPWKLKRGAGTRQAAQHPESVILRCFSNLYNDRRPDTLPPPSLYEISKNLPGFSVLLFRPPGRPKKRIPN